MRAYNWDYVAGFFDGEGCVRIFNYGEIGKRFCVRVSMAQTGNRGKELLEQIQSFLAEENISSRIYADPSRLLKGWQNCYALTISKREDCDLFLRKALPYLRIKHTEAQDVLRFSQIFPTRKRGPKPKIEKEIDNHVIQCA